jgi:diguanylate cyclase (GGDEF)-like protein
MLDEAQRPIAVLVNAEQWASRSLDSILTPNGYTVVRAQQGAEALDHIRRTPPDVVLIDSALPDGRGIDLCRALREADEVALTIPILITGQEPPSREMRISVLRAGGWDYFAFPFDAEELLLKVRAYTRCKAAADSAREATMVDPVTGFYSARGLLRRAQELGADASRHSRAVACVTLAPDLEAAAGEASPASPDLIRDVGQVLGGTTRGSDVVGRMGQSEFVVLAPGTDSDGAVRLARRLSEAAEAIVSIPGGAPVRFRAGCYAVTNFRDAGVEPVELMVRATLALRRSQTQPETERIQLYGSESAPS